ncbi:hypothetical protein LJ707_17680 [Mucilaginibacter sp. UR6-1]|uniref:hypothetical protein n=1 Tax=Mucilaginibacter sp. UR6-1 TaxID=1435643 RepID=UPI001E5E6F1C|nr:hypothetical protein [Mucilaginibacter sp. UR6-1]MCC8410777.1 hypothetical protein [Mucilaginibacter sp. UR6-1]
MSEQKKKIFPFTWVLLAIVIMAFIAYLLYVNGPKGNRSVNLQKPEVDLIDQRENDTTVVSFIRFINDDHNRMGLDHEYSNKALLKLSSAVSAMAQAVGYAVKADLNKAETDANKITRDPFAITHADNIRKAADILSEAMANLQQAKYPSLAGDASAVSSAAQQINPDVLTLDQKNKVKLFFERSAQLLEKMN